MSVASGDGKSEDGVNTLWDTGATYCGISLRLAERLGLKVRGYHEVTYGNGETSLEPVYLVRLRLSKEAREVTVWAEGFKMKAYDFIVGMNIIGNGRFLLEPDGKGGMHFTFEVPA